MIKIDWVGFIMYKRPLGFYAYAISGYPDMSGYFVTKIGWSLKAFLGMFCRKADAIIVYKIKRT